MAMNRLFGNLTFTKVYLKFLLIHSPSAQNFVDYLKKVFRIITENGLTINFQKTKFAVHQTKNLGAIISEKGIQPDDSNIPEFESIRIKNKKHLQKILGFIYYFRPFIPKLAANTTSLYDIIRKPNSTGTRI